MVSLHDIDARKQSEAALRASEARTRSIVETAGDGIITLDENGVIETFNRAAERIFGSHASDVIGRAYPMDRIRTGLGAIPAPLPRTDADGPSVGMMTTDTVPKVAEAVVAGSTARVVGMAKGVGMIEPDMATHISLLFTDASVTSAALDAMFRRVVDSTVNCVSVDTDTSTSDSTIILASGRVDDVDPEALEAAIHTVALDLTKQIARDGEGAQTLIEVYVDAARDASQAKRVAKAIVNSPLVKTAVHGGDPNWGRVAMAIGKCSDDTDIDQDAVVIRFGTHEVYPRQLNDADLAALSSYMRGTEVLIHVSLATGDAEFAVWGCDLSAEYVRFNADYTT